MQTIDLTLRKAWAPRGSQPIPVVKTEFSDGQHDIRLDGDVSDEDDVLILSDATSFSDLQDVIVARAALGKRGRTVNLWMPYLPGARADRRFSSGGSQYLKEVTASIINSLKFDSVTCVDVHSDVAENVIDNMVPIPFHDVFGGHIGSRFPGCHLVSPDAGAAKKVHASARAIGAAGVVHASKDRNVATGRITGVTFPDHLPDAPLVVCDDIFDGGRTFLELGRALRSAGAKEVHLCVTHWIGSNAAVLDEVRRIYDSISTTDSCVRLNGAGGYASWPIAGCETHTIPLVP